MTNKSSNSSQPKAGTPYRRSINIKNINGGGSNSNNINLNSNTLDSDLQKFTSRVTYKAKLAKSKTIN